MENNPYAPTKAALNEPVTEEDNGSVGAERLASRGKRMSNLMIDDIIYYILLGGLLVSVNLQALVEAPTWVPYLLLTGVRSVYYLACEATMGRTVGKFVTGTRVVDVSGGKPTFGQIVIRTLCRLVPFEPFSFLFGDPVGWHDSWSKTRVILVRTR